MMPAFSLDFGPGVISVATIIGGIVTLYLQSRKARIAATEANKELKPNGGTSMRDAIDRIEHNQVEFQSEIAKIHQRLTGLEQPPVP